MHVKCQVLSVCLVVVSFRSHAWIRLVLKNTLTAKGAYSKSSRHSSQGQSTFADDRPLRSTRIWCLIRAYPSCFAPTRESLHLLAKLNSLKILMYSAQQNPDTCGTTGIATTAVAKSLGAGRPPGIGEFSATKDPNAQSFLVTLGLLGAVQATRPAQSQQQSQSLVVNEVQRHEKIRTRRVFWWSWVFLVQCSRHDWRSRNRSLKAWW